MKCVVCNTRPATRPDSDSTVARVGVAHNVLVPPTYEASHGILCHLMPPIQVCTWGLGTILAHFSYYTVGFKYKRSERLNGK